MQLNFIRLSEIRLRDVTACLTGARLVSILLVLIVPGGLLVPLCYGAYEAIRRAYGR
jgi:hypothetical protein